jgi:cystathionine beta-synthase
LGVVEERSLLEKIYRNPVAIDAPVKSVMDDPLPIVEAGGEVSSLFGLFRGATNGAIVADNGRIIGIITRSDLLDFVAHRRSFREEI